MITFVKPEFEHTDDRGYLKQLVSSGWNQTNVIFSEKGTNRGGHYHKNNTEMFYVIQGAFELVLEKDEVTKNFNIKSGDMFVVEPNVVHTFNYTEDTYIIAFYDKGVVKGDEKDIYEKSLFKKIDKN
ncbi:cupin domain-containing protein [bacterium]